MHRQHSPDAAGAASRTPVPFRLAAGASVLAAGALLLVAGPAAAQEEAEPGAEAGAELTADLLSAFDYRFIGPANPSGRVTALAVPDEPMRRVMYAGMASGGVWKTANGGTTWEPVFDDQGTSSVGDVAVAPWNHEVVWVGTGERNSLRSNSWGDGLYRSVDGGKSWEHMGLEDTREIGRIALHPRDSSVAYVAALGHLWGPNPERGVYKTTDGGESWQKVLFVNDTTGFVDLKMSPEDPDVLYAAAWHRLRWGGGHMEGAGEGSGLYRSTDGGRSWTELTAPGNERGLPSRKLGRVGIEVFPQNPDIVYAVIQVAHGAKNPNVSPFGGLFRSDDGGDSWTRVNDLSAVPDYYYNEVWVNPTDPGEVWLAATRLYHSTDGGHSFREVRQERVHVDYHAMWISPEHPDHVVVGNDGGVYSSRDGGKTWAHHVIPASQFYEVDVDTTKAPYHVCGGTQDNGTWCGPSRTRERVGITDADWYKVFGGDGFHSAVSPDSAHLRYAEYQYGNVRRLDVRKWEYTNIKPIAEDAGAESGYSFRWDWNTPFVISHHDPTTLYLGSNHLFRVTQRGRDWEILGPDMTRQNRFRPEPEVSHTSYHSLHSVAESALDASVLWAGSNDGLLWASTDGGETWRNVTDDLPDGGPPPPCWVSEIETSRFEPRTAFVTYDCHRRDDYSPYVFRTTDAGETWTDITGDLPDGEVTYVVKQDALNPDLLYLGTHTGVYVTVDGGGHWARLNGAADGGGAGALPTVDVRDLELVPRAKELAVGTFGRSLYVLDVSALQELTPDVLETDVHLFPVPSARQYNPKRTYGAFGDRFFRTGAVSPSATITYYLRDRAEGDVTLEIREPVRGNSSSTNGGQEGEPDGEVIRSLTGDGDAGIHRVTWDLRRDEPRPREVGGPLSDEERRRVLPGTFTVTLKAGNTALTEEIVVEEGWEERTPGRVR